MSIKIGDNNRISKTIIANNSVLTEELKKKNFITRHPLLSKIIFTLITGLVTGLVLMFSFWKQVIMYIEKLIGG